MRHAVLFVVAMVLLLGGIGRVRADPITDLFNTGVNGDGTVSMGGSVDQQYTLLDRKAKPPALVPAYVASSIPNTYLGNDLYSQWIGADPDLTQTLSGKDTLDYQTTFTINPGFDPTTAMIAGSIASGATVDILLNGVDMTEISVNPATFTSFNLNTGFRLGTNTLDFILTGFGTKGAVVNDGLRVEMSGSVEPASAAPAPSTLAMLGMAATSFAGYFGWRRRQQPVPA